MADQNGKPNGTHRKITLTDEQRRLSQAYREAHGRIRAHTVRMPAQFQPQAPLVATPAPKRSATPTLKFDAVKQATAAPAPHVAQKAAEAKAPPEDYWADLRHAVLPSTKPAQSEDMRATLLKSAFGKHAEACKEFISGVESELSPVLNAIRARPAELKRYEEAKAKADEMAKAEGTKPAYPPFPQPIALEVVSSGGRAYSNEEDAVGAVSTKVADTLIMNIGARPDGRMLLCMAVDAILSSAPLTETEGKGEVEIRNGFYRAVAWCVCAQTNLSQLREYLSRNHLALIDAMGIATGISGAKRLAPDESMRLTFDLISHKWTSTGFNHMQTILMKAAMKGEVDMRLASLFITALMAEAERYQRISQTTFLVSAEVRNLSVGPKGGKAEKPGEAVAFLSENAFYELIHSRGFLSPEQQEMVGQLHMAIAGKFAGYAHAHEDEKAYFVGYRPREIAHMFTTIANVGMGFMLGNPRVKEAVLKLLDKVVENGGNPLLLTADVRLQVNLVDFKRILLLNLFTSQAEMEKYGHLYGLLSGMHISAEPNLADIHADHIRQRENEPQQELFPGGDDPF